MCSQPAAAASGTVPSNRARPRSAIIKIGRRGNRSAHTPANRLRKMKGKNSNAPSKPISNGVAFSTSTAVRGMASSVICVPSSETVSPVHSLRKSQCRQRLIVVEDIVTTISGPAPCSRWILISGRRWLVGLQIGRRQEQRHTQTVHRSLGIDWLVEQIVSELQQAFSVVLGALIRELGVRKPHRVNGIILLVPRRLGQLTPGTAQNVEVKRGRPNHFLGQVIV